jgi:carboxypeptidase C (cathepsin A)
VKLAPDQGRMELTIGECTLDVGDEPTKERRSEPALKAGLAGTSTSQLPVTKSLPPASAAPPAKDEKSDQFFGQSGDIEAVGDFIRLWTTRHKRWLSPKYLCGESYGVFRAAGLADHLHSRYGMYLNGLILVSGVLDFATLREGSGNDLPALLFLPTFTATAQYHKRLPADLQSDLPKALVEAREFIRTEYPAALLRGAALPESDRKKIAAKIARLTGLPQKLIASYIDVTPEFLSKIKSELLKKR